MVPTANKLQWSHCKYHKCCNFRRYHIGTIIPLWLSFKHIMYAQYTTVYCTVYTVQCTLYKCTAVPTTIQWIVYGCVLLWFNCPHIISHSGWQCYKIQYRPVHSTSWCVHSVQMYNTIIAHCDIRHTLKLFINFALHWNNTARQYIYSYDELSVGIHIK